MATTPDSESLAALAAQLADLRGKVVYLQSRIERAGLGSADLPAQVAELAQAVAALSHDETAARHTAPYWLGLDGAEHAERLAELGAWVSEVLAVNYPDAMRCACWASHPAAIWELSTLREEWLRVYDRTYPDLAGALAWHDRWLPGVAARVNAVMKDCAAGCTGRPRSAIAS
jgi:hypothetical protein